MALAYVSVKMHNDWLHPLVLMLNWLSSSGSGKVGICAKFFLTTLWDEASVALLDPQQSCLFIGFVGWSELVFLHSSDHQELWSLWNWQSGSWVATITLGDRLRGEKTSEITFTASWGCKYQGVMCKNWPPVEGCCKQKGGISPAYQLLLTTLLTARCC